MEDIKYPQILIIGILKRTQFIGDNKWECNILGEKRLVTTQEVQWYCHTLQDAVNSFNTEEMESYTIKNVF